MNKDVIQNITTETIQRYNKRYEKLGYHVTTLGWGSEEQQNYRFQQTLTATNFNNKVVLDIGCGFCDYYNFLKNEQLGLKNYLGWDINPALIEEAKSRFNQNDTISIEKRNILQEDETLQPISDIAVSLGVLNFNLKDKADNYEYSFNFIKKAFSLVNEVLVVDFLSENLVADYPKEDFVFYHNPAKMLEFALSLTPNVVLKHNYAAIPQKEFMLFLYK